MSPFSALCVSDTPDDTRVPRIKVCGVTLPDQAAHIAGLGVWAVGGVFARESPRHLEIEAGARMFAAVPRTTARVGVFVEGTVREIAATAHACGLTHVQVHRPVDVDALRAVSGCAVIEAFAVATISDVVSARASKADMVLLDTFVRGLHGGTGTRFEWDLLAEAPLGRPFALAGGLTPENVGEAVQRVSPQVLDVSSGVESSPGVKDLDRVARFVQNVQSAAGAGVA
jgi:phosphoribosylanthranilate isomerase